MKKALIVLFFGASVLFSCFLFAFESQEKEEKGSLAIYFMGEMVGYEEYTLQLSENGYWLTVKGKMTKPIALEIETLDLHVDRNFIPLRFHFKGLVSGVRQEIISSISDGQVENTIKVKGEEEKNSVRIKRDAFLLPNPIYSPFIFLTKKFRCSLQEKTKLSAYIIPQFEALFTLEPREEDPCWLIMNLTEMEYWLETDSEGTLKTLCIPSRNLKIVQKSSP